MSQKKLTSQKKRNILDDVADGVRQVLDEIDRLLNPDKYPKPAPVPIPVETRHPRPYNDPYR